MFSNLKPVHTTAVSGTDRRDFAQAYLQQCVTDRFVDHAPSCEFNLNITLGEGDTRPLVRYLRMLGFYVCALLKEENGSGKTETTTEQLSGPVKVSVSQFTTAVDTESDTCKVEAAGKSIELAIGSFQNLLPKVPTVFDNRTKRVISQLQQSSQHAALMADKVADLSQVIDFYFAKTLAPAVVVSHNQDFIQALVSALGEQQDMHGIAGVDASSYKMMKSLYDPNDTPNLRDDILGLGRGAFVAVELLCESTDAQLCIREIIEDSPSMTAFSTSRSALYKAGLVFGVYVKGDITPEVRSRASLVL